MNINRTHRLIGWTTLQWIGCLVNRVPGKCMVHSYRAGGYNYSDKACMQKATCARQTTNAAIDCMYNTHREPEKKKEGETV